jgi:hypothetical protein
MMRRILPLLGLTAMAFALTVRADQPAAKKEDSPDKKSADIKDLTTLRQQILAKRFAQFKADLLRVKQRLEKGSPEDRDKAKALQNALDRIDEVNLDTKFGQLVEVLKSKSLNNVNDVQDALERSRKLAEEIRILLNILREDNRAARLRDERKRLEEMIRELEGIIKDQKIVRAKTAMERSDKDDLSKGQRNVTDRTGNLVKKLGGPDEKRGAGQKKDDRAQAKGNSKGGGKEGDSKGKGKGEGESKKGESKAGEKNSGENNPANKNDNKGQDQAKEKGAGKGEGQKADAKGQGKGEGKQGDSKPKPAQPQAKQGGSKGKGKGEGESKPKQGGGESQAKGNGQKGGETRGGKPGESKPGRNKNSDEPPPGPGADIVESGKKPQPNNEPPQETADARKRVQDAKQHEKQAEKAIENDTRKPAQVEQDEAIKKLEEAKKKLEELLRQTREEELDRLLNALENRCRQMLEMQRQVKIATVEIHKQIQTNPDKKPNRTNHQDSGHQAEKEKEIVLEASKAIEMIEAEGSAVAFAEVFKQVRTDMEEVQKLLEKTQVGPTTQGIEQDIIDTLEDMIKALQKARQELQQNPNSKPPGPTPPPDLKLLDQIAELKMIRAMQIKVNKRTKLYGDEYVAKEGEQTSDEAIKGKLKELGDRQEKLFDVTMKIVKGDNK